MGIVEIKEMAREVAARVYALRELGHRDDSATFDPDPLIMCRRDRPTARLYLFHGFRDSGAYWQNEPAKGFVEQCLDAGMQVVLPTLPYARAGMFRAGGAAYRAGYLAMLEHLERRLPMVGKRFVGGISWGGYHAMLAAASQRQWDGYIAILPVAAPRVLREFWYLGHKSGPRIDGAALAAVPGFISYGTRDRRADWRAAAQLAAAAGVEPVIFEGRDHSAMGDELEMAGAWLRKQMTR